MSDSGDPSDSSLILHGKKLTLNDIIKSHLPHAKFAFLDACCSTEQTTEQNRTPSNMQDEVLHLAVAMQFSGFRSVVGTMWEKKDEDRPRVAYHFYREMMEGDEDVGQRHTRAARALWKVTRRMKEKQISMARWINFIHIGA